MKKRKREFILSEHPELPTDMVDAIMRGIVRSVIDGEYEKDKGMHRDLLLFVGADPNEVDEMLANTVSFARERYLQQSA